MVDMRLSVSGTSTRVCPSNDFLPSAAFFLNRVSWTKTTNEPYCIRSCEYTVSVFGNHKGIIPRQTISKKLLQKSYNGSSMIFAVLRKPFFRNRIVRIPVLNFQKRYYKIVRASPIVSYSYSVISQHTIHHDNHRIQGYDPATCFPYNNTSCYHKLDNLLSKIILLYHKRYNSIDLNIHTGKIGFLGLAC